MPTTRIQDHAMILSKFRYICLCKSFSPLILAFVILSTAASCNKQSADSVNIIPDSNLVRLQGVVSELGDSLNPSLVEHATILLDLGKAHGSQHDSALFYFDMVVAGGAESAFPYSKPYRMAPIRAGYSHGIILGQHQVALDILQANEIKLIEGGDSCDCELGRTRIQIANMFWELDSLAAANATSISALELVRKELGECGEAKNPMTLALETRGLVTSDLGDSESAARFYETAANQYLRSSSFGKLARVLGSYAWLELKLGDYDQASVRFDSALALATKYEADEYIVARLLLGLARSSLGLGLRSYAISLVDSALHVIERYDPDHRAHTLAESFAVMGEAFLNDGSTDEARLSIERGLDILSTANRSDPATRLYLLSSLVKVSFDEQNYDSAISIADRALSLLNSSGRRENQTLTLLRQKAEACLAQGGPKTVESFQSLGEALDKAEIESLAFTRALRVFSRWQHIEGDNSGAFTSAARVAQLELHELRNNLLSLSEKAASASYLRLDSAQSLMLSSYFELANPTPIQTESLLSITLNSKGSFTDLLLYQRRLQRRWEELKADSDSVSSLGLSSYYSWPESPSSESRFLESRKKSSSVSKRIENVLKEGYELVSYKSLKAEMSMSNQSLIDYRPYARTHTDGSTNLHYWGLCISPTGVTVLDLGSAQELDLLIEKVTGNIGVISSKGHYPSDSLHDAYVADATVLYDKLVKPLITSWPTDPSLIFVARDGNVLNLSFAGLIDDDGLFLIERFPIHYILSASDRGRAARQKIRTDASLIITNPEVAWTGMDQPSMVDTSTFVHIQRSLNEQCLSSVFPSEANVSSAFALIYESWKGSIVNLKGSEATPDETIQHLTQSTFAHFDAHGYFITKDCLDEESSVRVMVSPLAFSGLVLASDDQGRQTIDGLLTAERVAGLNLDDLDLVSLASCESALGVSLVGEGLLGLEKAFLVAGAGTVISSLWKIDDSKTKEFYRHLYSGELARLPLRVQEAQIQIIQDLKNSEFPPHPYFWAGFMSSGEWR